MQKAVISTIKIYQIMFSPGIGLLIPYSACRYAPTCSEYAIEAVQKYGTIKGIFLGLKRILSCNPFGGHGYKPLV